MIKAKYVTTNPCFLDWASSCKVASITITMYITLSGVMVSFMRVLILLLWSVRCVTLRLNLHPLFTSNIVQLQATRRNTSLQHSSHRFIPQHLMRFTFQSIIVLMKNGIKNSCNLYHFEKKYLTTY